MNRKLEEDSKTLSRCRDYKDDAYVIMLKKYAGDPIEQIKLIASWVLFGIITDRQKDKLLKLVE